MKDVLEEIVAWKRIEVDRFKQVVSEHDIHRQVEQILDQNQPVPSMSEALTLSPTGIINRVS